MATADHDLAPPPLDERARALWLQHAAGFILFEDVRRYARDLIDPGLEGDAHAAACKAIDDALYGLMMIVDGVTGVLENRMHAVRLEPPRVSRRLPLLRGWSHDEANSPVFA